MQLNPKFLSIEEIVSAYGGFGNLKIDLGCGFYKPSGFIGLDNMVGIKSQYESDNIPDIFIDLHNEPLPFEDGACAIVRSSHYLEHSNLDFTFQEAFRVLSEDGIFENIFPYALSDEGMFPGHSIFLTETWFRENVTFQTLFEIQEFHYRKSKSYENWNRLLKIIIPYRFARRHLYNVCDEIYLKAKKRKGND